MGYQEGVFFLNFFEISKTIPSRSGFLTCSGFFPPHASPLGDLFKGHIVVVVVVVVVVVFVVVDDEMATHFRPPLKSAQAPL